jgi:hypothetical protein
MYVSDSFYEKFSLRLRSRADGLPLQFPSGFACFAGFIPAPRRGEEGRRAARSLYFEAVSSSVTAGGCAAATAASTPSGST